MTRTRSRLTASSFALFLCLVLAPGAALAQQAPAAPKTRVAELRPEQAPVRTVAESQDARETRSELRQLLQRYSPTLAGVFKLDPTLLSNAEYLAPYPGLAEFLARHPEIARDPNYFFEDVELPWVAARNETRDPQLVMVNLWRDTMQGVMILFVLLVVTSALVWLIKTLIDYRRWSRLSKVQTEAHHKVLDRFSSNEDLLAYVQTPAGRRFLESAPISLDPAAPAVAVPLRRILWAVEAGCVIAAGGVGLQFVSGRVPAEISPMVLALGVLGVALGIGFIVAAAVSYFISKRMGLFQPPAPPVPTERV